MQTSDKFGSRHHWVSQTILEQFKDSAGRLHVYDANRIWLRFARENERRTGNCHEHGLRRAKGASLRHRALTMADHIRTQGLERPRKAAETGTIDQRSKVGTEWDPLGSPNEAHRSTAATAQTKRATRQNPTEPNDRAAPKR